MLSNLLLLSGSNIPFPGAKVLITQPKIKDIAIVGEKEFFLGCGLLNFSKDLLEIKDKTALSNYTDFDILLTLILNEKEGLSEQVKALKDVMTLLFPTKIIEYRQDGILLIEGESKAAINNFNFLEFKKIITKMFNLTDTSEVKPGVKMGEMGQKIAEKLKERHKQLAKKLGSEESDIFGRYISILAVGLGKDMNKLFEYTVYQLYDELKRFNAKREYDTIFKAKLAGAQNISDAEEWTLDTSKLGKEKNKEKK